MSVCVIGAINLDLVARVSGLPARGETVMAGGLTRYVGGKGANQAVAAARAGARVAMVGQVGADADGVWLRDYLEGEGIDVTAVGTDPVSPTGQAFITVADGGENCIVVIAGANAALQASGAQIGSARVLLAQLETAFAPVAAMFEAAPVGCIRILNAAPALAVGADLFARCDVVVLNETELATYAGVGAPPCGLDAIAEAVRRIGAKAAFVVTLGAQGVLVAEGGAIRIIPAHPVAVVDTVGAGDCFCGVLAAGLDAGLALHRAAMRANAAAAIAVTRPGAASAMPTTREINAVDAG